MRIARRLLRAFGVDHLPIEVRVAKPGEINVLGMVQMWTFPEEFLITIHPTLTHPRRTHRLITVLVHEVLHILWSIYTGIYIIGNRRLIKKAAQRHFTNLGLPIPDWVDELIKGSRDAFEHINLHIWRQHNVLNENVFPLESRKYLIMDLIADAKSLMRGQRYQTEESFVKWVKSRGAVSFADLGYFAVITETISVYQALEKLYIREFLDSLIHTINFLKSKIYLFDAEFVRALDHITERLWVSCETEDIIRYAEDYFTLVVEKFFDVDCEVRCWLRDFVLYVGGRVRLRRS